MTHTRPAYVLTGALKGVRLTTYDAAAAATRFADVRVLYTGVFAEPPHNEGPNEFDLFTTRWWPQQISQPGFRLVVADHPDHGLIGVTYGYQLAADGKWWTGSLGPIKDTAEWPGRTVAIIEMMVHRQWRRCGLATCMHQRFLDARTEERVTLLVRPDNHPAREAYQQWGYRCVGQIRPFRTAPVYDAMVLDRHVKTEAVGETHA